MSVFEIDAAREERQAELNRLIQNRDKIAAEIKRCTPGPEMDSLCREYTAIKKKIQVVRGC